MINRAMLLRLSIIAAVVCVVATGAALALSGSAMAGGVVLGGLLGAIPFLSWTYIAGAMEGSNRRKALAVLLLLGKMLLYSGALYVFVARPIVNPVGVMVGIFVVVFTFITGSLMAPKPAEVRS